MRENELIAKIEKAARSLHRPDVRLGIGDDCAAVVVQPGEEILLTTDLLLEDVHFWPSVHPPAAVGHKALARGISDIAAMGGEPRFCLVSLAFAPWTKPAWAAAFYKGLRALAQRYHVALVGGDIGHARILCCDIVVVGAVSQGQALRRSGARDGDAIYVSGVHGGAALGLEKRKGRAWQAHLRPEPRVALGRYLRQSLGATAAMDVSDGVAIDLSRLCRASGLAARLDIAPPRFPGATQEMAWHGGDDYELLFAVPSGTRVPDHFENIPLTRLGTLNRGRPGRLLFRSRPLRASGYDHFAVRDSEPKQTHGKT